MDGLGFDGGLLSLSRLFPFVSRLSDVVGISAARDEAYCCEFPWPGSQILLVPAQLIEPS